MECAVCKAKVNDFKLQKLCVPPEPVMNAPMYAQEHGGSAFDTVPDDIPMSLDTGFQDFIDRAQGSSTPVPDVRGPRKLSSQSRASERVVLRIDNVPWVCHQCSCP